MRRTGFMLLLLVMGIFVLLSSPDYPVQGQSDEVIRCEDDPEADELNRTLVNSFWAETNFCNHTVEFSEFRSGGPAPDGILRINPEDVQLESIEDARFWLEDQSPVIALEINGDARAYPLLILTRHEIVNDVVGDEPVAVTFCPLCNSALVYSRAVENDAASPAEPLTFGVSGLLRNSDLVMFDDQTKSWWQQLTGEGLVGTYAGEQLTLVPSLVVGFGQFAAQFPQGQVLSQSSGWRAGLGNPADGYNGYGGNPYELYDSRNAPYGGFFDADQLDTRLPALERVLAGTIDGQPIAYPFSVLSEVRVVNDTVGERDVVAFWQAGKASALDRRDIDASRDVGMAALYRRTVDDQTLTFSLNADGTFTDEETGSTWNVFGLAIGGELEGTQLRPELAAPHFWFAWAAFRPETLVYGLE
ncbi:MAG: DUF3179 domain-containing protein [Anaerolineae bacterium]